MSTKTKGILDRLGIAFISNLVSFAVSTLVILIVPKFISTAQYGYFQMYLFYVGYIGFANFGWPEGVMLRNGGRRYDQLDHGSIKTQLGMFSVVSLVVTIGLFTVALCNADLDKRIVWTGVGICALIFLPKHFLEVLLHITNRTREYALGIMIERITYFVGVGILLFSGVREFYGLILCELLGRFLGAIYIFICSRTLFSAKALSLKSQVSEAIINIRAGIMLTLANLMGLFLTGIPRQFIEWHWSVETFAKVSLALSISNMMMIFVRAVSVVLFPALKTTDTQRLPTLYIVINDVLMVALFGTLIFYMPLKEVFSTWLPKYEQSLYYMMLLFPMCVFECKMSLLLETYMKALRMERKLFGINVGCVALSLALSFLSIFVLDNLELAVLSILVITALRCTLAEILVHSKIGLHQNGDTVIQLMLAAFFVAVTWFIKSWYSTALYVVAYLGFVFIKRKGLSIAVGLISKRKND